jgi:hypothetical protein
MQLLKHATGALFHGGSVHLAIAGLLLCGIALSPAQVTVQIGQNFTGTSYNPNAPAIPPDSNGAIGPKHFMEFINGTVAVYNKTSGANVQRKTDVKFWGDAGVLLSSDSGLSDPRVIYDPRSDRWFSVQIDYSTVGADLCGLDPTFYANDFLLAVSVTNDPTKSWHGFLFQSDPDTGAFADFPTLGLDANAVYISGDFYKDGEDNPVGAGLVAIPKADLLARTPTVDNRTWLGIASYANRGQVLQPAICFDGSSSGNVLAVGDIGNDDSPHSNLVSFAVLDAGSAGGASLTPSAHLDVPAYVVPFNADMGVPQFAVTQPDGTANLIADDARLTAKVYAVGGVLYAAHSTELDGRIAIRWYRVGASNHTVLEAGTISDPDLDLFYPSIAANGYGTVVIAYNSSGINHFISCYAVVGSTANNVTTFGTPLLLQEGTIEYHGDDELQNELLDEYFDCTLPVVSRWGDYSATSVDPSDPNRFWTIQMFPEDTDIWSTQITELITFNPVLSITRSNSQAIVSWPKPSLPFQLESTPTLSPTSTWTMVTQTFSTNNGRVFFQKPLAGGNTFFRLHQP